MPQNIIDKCLELRQDNKTLKLLELIWKSPGISRRDIGIAAKLSRGSVTKNMTQLIEDGYVTEGPSSTNNSARLGRNTIGLYVDPGLFYLIGISLYRKSRAELIDASGKVVCAVDLQLEMPDRHFHYEQTLSEIRRAFAEMLAIAPQEKIIAVGIAMAGSVDFDKGDIFSSFAFGGAKNFNLKDFVRENFGLECFLINVSHLWPVMEKNWGAAMDMNNFITIDDSLCSGFFLNGSLFRGNNNYAGELSYMKISESDEAARDGRCGLLRQKYLQCNIVGRLKKMIADGGHPKILEIVESPEDINMEKIVQSIELGDKFLEQEMSRRYELVGEAAVNLAYILNPEAILLEEWTARCPQCTVDVVARKLSSYEMTGWPVRIQVLSGKCSNVMASQTVAYLAADEAFQKAIRKNKYQQDEEQEDLLW